MPALEAYAISNIATQNLFGGSPLQFLLGDLNSTGGTGVSGLMGPQPGVLTLKELLLGEYNVGSSGNMSGATVGAGSTAIFGGAAGTRFGSPLEIVSENFKNGFGNIVVGSVLTTAGFKIANKVLSKPKNKFNSMLRKMGMGSTIQL